MSSPEQQSVTLNEVVNVTRSASPQPSQCDSDADIHDELLDRDVGHADEAAYPSQTTVNRGHGALIILLMLLFIGMVMATTKRVIRHTNTVVIVSLDGFRADYFPDKLKPDSALLKLGKLGVHAKRMRPVFPSETFPNHYTLATGLYPESHGIVANQFYDTAASEYFSSYSPKHVRESRWWLGEPIWVTAEQQGVRTMIFDWPGSEAEIKGIRASKYMRYNPDVPFETRIDTALQWLRLPHHERPHLVMVYMSQPDSSSHQYGPEASETLDAVHHLDSMVQRLVEGIERLPYASEVDLMVVSDHGLTDLSVNDTIILDDVLGNVTTDDAIVGSCSPVLHIWPVDEKQELDIYTVLKKVNPGLTMYRRDEMPERFHYRHSAQQRIAPLLGMVDPKLQVMSTQKWPTCKDKKQMRGYHGMDNDMAAMAGLFLAKGPSFRSGFQVQQIDSLDVYEIICRALDLEPAPNNGSTKVAKLLMKK